jgi:hypothetical protein
VRVVVVGAGGTGSAIVTGLPYLDQAMRARGHRFGLEVALMDADVVSETNCGRQLFSISDIVRTRLPSGTAGCDRRTAKCGRAAPQVDSVRRAHEQSVPPGVLSQANPQLRPLANQLGLPQIRVTCHEARIVYFKRFYEKAAVRFIVIGSLSMAPIYLRKQLKSERWEGRPCSRNRALLAHVQCKSPNWNEVRRRAESQIDIDAPVNATAFKSIQPLPAFGIRRDDQIHRIAADHASYLRRSRLPACIADHLVIKLGGALLSQEYGRA